MLLKSCEGFFLTRRSISLWPSVTLRDPTVFTFFQHNGVMSYFRTGNVCLSTCLFSVDVACVVSSFTSFTAMSFWDEAVVRAVRVG